jgi:hypothetical protein
MTACASLIFVIKKTFELFLLEQNQQFTKFSLEVKKKYSKNKSLAQLFFLKT